MTSSFCPPVLKKINKHLRDNNIQFEEIGHKYTIVTDQNSKYTSVTTFIHSHFPTFDADTILNKMMSSKSWREGHKYWNKSKEEIKSQWSTNAMNVSQLGTSLHYQIECFMNNANLLPGYTHLNLLNNYYETSENIPTKEWNYFLKFITEFPNLKPFRTEWTIYHEDLKLAGSIDMVYENEDNTLSIYDWKRVKNITTVNNYNKYAITEIICHIPDSNFWHYALQLNIYKAIVEEKYNKKVTELFLIRLHPEAEENTYEMIPIPFLTLEVKDLFQERKNSL
jgi:ATP-dependent exoDNAse (exonuclease V) beta subunit